MPREGPGFLIDLFFIWIMTMACLVVATALDNQFGRPIGLLLGIAAALIIVFLFLLAYYRVYLDERPLLGTASRTRFAILLFQLVLVGFVVGALLSPPDPFTQVIVAGVVIGLGTILSYWWVYNRATPEVGQAEA